MPLTSSIANKQRLRNGRKNCDELFAEMSERQKAEVKIVRQMGRVEAIKEFAKRLKHKEITAISCERFEGVVSADDIDKLVKEMISN